MPAVATPLPELLHRVFGHAEFRAHQQPVCEAAAAGRDVLLVMPTGAGKSLCYQLPALARGGTALVISPLIALMDDQAGKLSALNLRVARIHSGLPREASRQACRDYLDGNLDFLFIAPERLRVPGFPEMLARRKPALIAIDEAHCISQWGHDFRPDYRTLGQHLPALRPAPVIALTATATPTVQRDILRALDLRDPAVFITGFRRHNLQIEATEVSKPQRTAFISKLLQSPASRPAIVYAGSRKSAEELASSLGSRCKSAAYHAGLDAGTRERVQTAFLSGKLDVVVATVAFGMGVDKADVRTVVHASLPGSVEAYYQEIGRAGRDGLPARAILLHSFADRKMHDFFIERDYPPVTELSRVAAVLGPEPTTIDHLQQRLRMDREVIERCVDKLLAQGAASADMEGQIRGTEVTSWQSDYGAQVVHRRSQVDRMVAFAEATGCRMTALVRHFGDTTDSARPCGQCDGCSPQQSTSAPAREPSAGERSQLSTILGCLRAGPRSAGKLFTDAAVVRDRKQFDAMVDALARAGLVHLTADTFRTDDGRDVNFRKVSLTPEGRDADNTAMATVWLRGTEETAARPARKRQSEPSASRRAPVAGTALDPTQHELLQKLKRWRLETAQAAGVPPFTIFHDSVLEAITLRRPGNVADLGAVRGIGPDKLDRFGAAVLALTREHRTEPALAVGTTQTPTRSRIQTGTAPRPEAQTQSRPQPSLVPHRAVAENGEPPGLARTRTIAPPLSVVSSANPLSGAQEQLAARLRDWRRHEAATCGVPTFFILSETAVRKIVALTPQSLDQLGTIPEIGPDKLSRYGADVLAVCRADHSSGNSSGSVAAP